MTPAKEIEMLTEKEKMVMDEIMRGSNFNGCKIDLSKEWGEQSLECGEYWAFADVRDYGCGMEKQAVRGIFGSLDKKGMIDIWEDDEDRTVWIHIAEKHFNKIREEYAGL